MSELYIKRIIATDGNPKEVGYYSTDMGYILFDGDYFSHHRYPEWYMEPVPVTERKTAEDFLTYKEWDKEHPVTGGVLYMGIANLLNKFADQQTSQLREELENANDMLHAATEKAIQVIREKNSVIAHADAMAEAIEAYDAGDASDPDFLVKFFNMKMAVEAYRSSVTDAMQDDSVSKEILHTAADRIDIQALRSKAKDFAEQEYGGTTQSEFIKPYCENSFLCGMLQARGLSQMQIAILLTTTPDKKGEDQK